MKRLQTVATVMLAIFTCLCLMVATERRAYAYVDPGSGFLVLQSMASVMATAAFFMRRRIKALFTRPKVAKPTLVLPVTAHKNDSRNAA